MDSVNIKISNIKSIISADIEIPLEKGIYGLVGANGCGKSTVLLAIAQLNSKYRLGGILKKEDYDMNSFVEFEYKGIRNRWTPNERGLWDTKDRSNIIQFNGMYEGSLFYGARFDDSRLIEDVIDKNRLKLTDIVDSDDYVIKKLSFILHGNYLNYGKLKRIKNKSIAQGLGLRNAVYLNEVRNNYISQYRMSSGECLLISLLHFIYNSIIRSSLPKDKKILVLIDEIELALHPIAVSRLLDLLNELISENSNLVVILTSHAPEVIKKLKPANMLKVDNHNGILKLESNCYPSYLIRDVYSHDGFDYLLLTEDILAKSIVEKILLKESFRNNKLIHIVPAGGYENVLTLQRELLNNNILGVGKNIFSILDGDIKSEIKQELNPLKKLFLPVNSIEKYLYETVFLGKHPLVKKIINDKYFTLKSLDQLVSEHNQKYTEPPKQPDKKFYFRLIKDLSDRGISEESFINNLVDDLIQNVDFGKFTEDLRNFLR